MAILTAVIDIENQKTVDLLLEDNGQKEKKTVKYDDFLTIVNDKEVVTYTAKIPKLPENTFFINWADNTSFKIGIYVPKDKRYVNFLGQDLNVCYPNLLFIFDVKNKRIVGTLVFAVKDSFDILSETSEIFNYPYGNVSPGGGNVCWGNNKLPDIEGPYDLMKVFWIFFGSKTNNDLWSSGLNAACETLDGIYVQMSKADVFDDNQLVSNGILKKVM